MRRSAFLRTARERFATTLSLSLAAALAVSPAAATPPPPSTPTPTDLVIDASPVLGTGASTAVGWNEVVVVVQNNGGKPGRGRIEVSTSLYGHERREFRSTAPFVVGPGVGVHVRVPMLVAIYGDLQVEVFDEAGRQISLRSFSSFSPTGVSLLDVSDVSRLRGALNDTDVGPSFALRGGGRSGAPPLLSVGSPRYDPATGDPVLPDRAALYSTADVVLMRSDALAHLAGAELDALAGYVLSGGTLAVVVARPEDVRHPTLVAFAGGAVTRQSVFAATLADLVLPPRPGGGTTSRSIPPASNPSGDLAETLAGYAGGNLHGSLYGSSAAYGLGEVHLLAFDPTRKPALDDPWAQARVVDLARRAFDRRSTQIFRPGADPYGVQYGRVRQQLDPNESSRWAIGAAALLLIAYAILAGPVSFSLAGKEGRPLRALRRLPVFSALAFALVVAIGVFAKGVTGRARHLTLIEAGAGMAKGSARRFRGFYASRAQELTVRTTDASSVVSTALSDTGDRQDHLLVDRDGVRLASVSALPWQTVVVREDGFASLGDGIALVKDGASGVAVINRSGRDLRAVILRDPAGASTYFARIKDGDRVTSASGRKLSADPDGRAWEAQTRASRRAGTMPVHPLGEIGLAAVLGPDTPGLADAWSALGEAAGDTVDWFPQEVPVLIGQLDGGEGRPSDTGLHLDSDRLLVRVVGWGGRP